MENKTTIKLVIISSLATMFALVALFGGGYLLYTKFISPYITSYKTEKEIKSIIEEIGKVVVLPEGDSPQVATILNAEQLRKNDNFFASAKNGDATLFYEKSGIIILFNLKTHKLMNMGTIATSSASSSETAPASSFKFSN